MPASDEAVPQGGVASHPSVAEQFALLATDIHWSELDVAVRELLLHRAADHFGLVAAGQATPSGRAAIRAVAGDAGSHPILFDGDQVTASAAALVHGTLAHVLDFDDTFPDSVIHPTSVVLPAALAAAPDDALGCEVLEASLAGYEFLARVGHRAGRSFHARGFHATSVLGPVAAALAACRVRRESVDVCVSAMGLAGSMSGGLLEFLSDGTWSKRMHTGWAAQGGVRAADLAAAGFRGPSQIIEGRHGIFRSFLGEDLGSPEKLFADLGTRWDSQTSAWKFHPCAHVIHPFIEMARYLMLREGLRVDDIAHVRCDVAPWYAPIVCEPRHEKIHPASEYQARASLPYVLSLEFAGLGLGSDGFEDTTRARRDLLALRERIEHVSDDGLDGGFGARMHVTAVNGDAWLLVPTDVPDAGGEGIRLRRKFNDNLASIAREDDAERIWGSLQSMPQRSVSDLIATTLT